AEPPIPLVDRQPGLTRDPHAPPARHLTTARGAHTLDRAEPPTPPGLELNPALLALAQLNSPELDPAPLCSPAITACARPYPLGLGALSTPAPVPVIPVRCAVRGLTPALPAHRHRGRPPTPPKELPTPRTRQITATRHYTSFEVNPQVTGSRNL